MATGGRGRHLLVVAKAPVPGRVKTRLCPPLTHRQAASVAEAALAETLQAVAACSAERRLLALDGEPGEWLPPGFTVFAQREGDLSERLAGAWADADGPGIQIGMDTPQVTAQLLDGALDALDSPDVSAVLGPALDGGWWAIGFSENWGLDVFKDVAMSTPETGSAQVQTLEKLGHTVGLLPPLRDIDTVSDAVEVARAMPAGALSAALDAAGISIS